jgi:hypothetical protein
MHELETNSVYMGKCIQTKRFWQAAWKNENVEGNIELDAATINAEDEEHVFRAHIVSNGELRYWRRRIGDCDV